MLLLLFFKFTLCREPLFFYRIFFECDGIKQFGFLHLCLEMRFRVSSDQFIGIPPPYISCYFFDSGVDLDVCMAKCKFFNIDQDDSGQHVIAGIEKNRCFSSEQVKYLKMQNVAVWFPKDFKDDNFIYIDLKRSKMTLIDLLRYIKCADCKNFEPTTTDTDWCKAFAVFTLCRRSNQEEYKNIYDYCKSSVNQEILRQFESNFCRGRRRTHYILDQ